MSKSYSARVMKFRKGVYANRKRITPGCQVLLLRLADSMDAKGIVSIPRSKLAEEFDCPPVRITEWINQAKAAGFIDTVRRGRPGVTAVYQGLYVNNLVREGVPLLGTPQPTNNLVREGVPQIEVQRYARAVPQVVQTPVSEQTRGAIDARRGSEEASA